VNHRDRLKRLQSELKNPLLVTKLPNIRYLTGFSGSNAFLLVWPDRATFVTDGRYAELSEPLIDALESTALEVYQGKSVPSLVGLMGSGTFQLEADDASWDFMKNLAEEFSGDLEPSTGIVEELRKVKDAEEVAALRSAAAAGDATFGRLEKLVEGARNESDLGWALLNSMRSLGAEVAGWDPIVAAGANGSRPHHQTGGDPIVDGPLLLDYGCTVDGYHSDMSRTVWLGADAPDAETVKIRDAVAEAQQAGIDAVAPGVAVGDVDLAARQVLEGLGYGEAFVHSTGHGVGLEIHEAPWAAKGQTELLEPGHVLTVEPGIYLAGQGGVRIEDMVLVTDSGYEILTTSSRDLV